MTITKADSILSFFFLLEQDIINKNMSYRFFLKKIIYLFPIYDELDFENQLSMNVRKTLQEKVFSSAQLKGHNVYDRDNYLLKGDYEQRGWREGPKRQYK